MCWKRFLENVGTRLHFVLWPDNAPPTPEQQFRQTYDDLRQLTARLAWHRRQVKELRQCIGERQQQSGRLTSLVAVHLGVADGDSAWRHALQLDQMRQESELDREQIASHEHAHQDLLIKVEHLKRRLADLQTKI